MLHVLSFSSAVIPTAACILAFQCAVVDWSCFVTDFCTYDYVYPRESLLDVCVTDVLCFRLWLTIDCKLA